MLNRVLARRTGLMILNVWIVFHFFAICTAPASIPPSTTVAQHAWRYCSGYLKLLYFNHGYHFFAPEPGGATLLSYEARGEGEPTWDRVPNRKMFPRLRYHRHFTMTEQMAALFNSRPELKPLIARTFATEIARQNDATSVALSQVQHQLSTASQVRAGRPIDDPITYNELWLGEFQWNETQADR